MFSYYHELTPSEQHTFIEIQDRTGRIEYVPGVKDTLVVGPPGAYEQQTRVESTECFPQGYFAAASKPLVVGIPTRDECNTLSGNLYGGHTMMPTRTIGPRDAYNNPEKLGQLVSAESQLTRGAMDTRTSYREQYTSVNAPASYSVWNTMQAQNTRFEGSPSAQ